MFITVLGFKGSQSPGLGLHGTESSSVGLLRLPDVLGEMKTTSSSFVYVSICVREQFLWFPDDP